MAVTLDIMAHMNNRNYEEYFKNWARVWCMKAKEEYLAHQSFTESAYSISQDDINTARTTIENGSYLEQIKQNII